MPLVIVIAQQKGGAGKTMLAANLAVAFAPHCRTALLDTDPQHSLTRWHGLRSAQSGLEQSGLPQAGLAPIDFSDISGWRLQGTLDQLRRTHDVVVVDSPPHVDTDARRAVRAADLVLVPVQPSAPDLWGGAGTMALAVAERRRAILVINRAPTMPKQRAVALAEVQRAGHTVLPAMLGNRSIFAQAFAQGLGVLEAAPRTIAAREMRALWDVIKGMTE